MGVKLSSFITMTSYYLLNNYLTGLFFLGGLTRCLFFEKMYVCVYIHTWHIHTYFFSGGRFGLDGKIVMSENQIIIFIRFYMFKQSDWHSLYKGMVAFTANLIIDEEIYLFSNSNSNRSSFKGAQGIIKSHSGGGEVSHSTKESQPFTTPWWNSYPTTFTGTVKSNGK